MCFVPLAEGRSAMCTAQRALRNLSRCRVRIVVVVMKVVGGGQKFNAMRRTMMMSTVIHCIDLVPQSCSFHARHSWSVRIR